MLYCTRNRQLIPGYFRHVFALIPYNFASCVMHWLRVFYIPREGFKLGKTLDAVSRANRTFFAGFCVTTDTWYIMLWYAMIRVASD